MNDHEFNEQLAEFAHRCIMGAREDEQLAVLVAKFNAEQQRLEEGRRRLEDERANLLEQEEFLTTSIERNLRDEEREVLRAQDH